MNIFHRVIGDLIKPRSHRDRENDKENQNVEFNENEIKIRK